MTGLVEFDVIRCRAQARFVTAADLDAALPKPEPPEALAAIADSHYLSLMSRRVFRAGLRHRMVDARWPAFEAAFAGFRPDVCAAMSDEQLERAMAQPGVIRHWAKLRSIRDNAVMVCEIAAGHGSFGRWLAAWPVTDVVGLWQYFRDHGTQLGGNSGASFLRMAGKDTFLLVPDVVAALIRFGVVDRKPTSARARGAVQTAFNTWATETGLALCQLSRILSYSV